jgi:hypothetical protein
MSTVLDTREIDTAEPIYTAAPTPRTVPRRITTTLYDLISAVQTSVEPHDETLVVATVWHLLRTRRATWGEAGRPD